MVLGDHFIEVEHMNFLAGLIEEESFRLGNVVVSTAIFTHQRNRRLMYLAYLVQCNVFLDGIAKDFVNQPSGRVVGISFSFLKYSDWFGTTHYNLRRAQVLTI